MCSKVEFLSNRARPEPFAEKRACDTAGFPSLATPLYIRCSLCQLRPRREKRIHRQHDEQCCRWILFFVEAQSAHPVCGRKNGGSAPVAERAVRRTSGKGQKVGRRGIESAEMRYRSTRESRKGARGESKRRTRRIEKARGESKKRAGESKNKGCAIEKQGIAESKRRGKNLKECGARNPKAHGRAIRKRAICPPPCRDEEFG